MDTVTLEIPSTRDDQEMVRLLKLELALAVYRDGKLSPGRAAELAGMGRWEFSEIAKARGVATPYTAEMVHEDFARGSGNF
jgi:predicted HTH domain antitoxin